MLTGQGDSLRTGRAPETQWLRDLFDLQVTEGALLEAGALALAIWGHRQGLLTSSEYSTLFEFIKNQEGLSRILVVNADSIYLEAA